LARGKIINEEDAIFTQKNQGENFSSQFLCSDFFFGGGVLVSRYATTPLIVALSVGHNDITRFHPWSPVTTENHLDHAKRKYSKSCSYDWHH
jgi:hypothetical protein